MKKFILILSFGLLFKVSVAQENSARFQPFVSYDEATLRASKILSKMSLDEKITIIGGYKDFNIAPFPQYNIPKVKFSDASQGVRLISGRDTVNAENVKSVAFPAPILLASSWNPGLSYKYAEAVGEECKTHAIDVLLGPGINIYRNSQCGRNFEYMGEDPFLTSRMVETYVAGMQSTGTMAVVKHFIANNTDLERKKSNSVVSDRALNEIYLPGFKAAVNAGVMGVMTSYNQLNGEWVGQSSHAITDILRKQLGFKGLIMTDWVSVFNFEKIIGSGQNLVMPKGISVTDAENLIKAGKIAESDINNMVLNILRSCIMMGFYDRDSLVAEAEHEYPQHDKIALETAREGIVMLKNKNNTLPLSNSAKILLTGKFANKLPKGGGSASVFGYNQVVLSEALRQNFNNVKHIERPSDQEIKNAETIIISTGTIDKEASDRSFDLPKEEDDFITHVCNLNPRTVIVVNSGSGINMSKWGKAVAIIYAWYPGQIGNVALSEILVGKVNPSGKLPCTIEKEFKDSPAFGYGKDVTPQIIKAKLGDVSNIYNVDYKEDIFVGYRWYEHQKIEPQFPFGYGLSYTSFKYSDLTVDPANFGSNGNVKVSFTIKNTGGISGAEIGQLYVSDVESSVERPLKELKGFKRVFLNPGETKKVELVLSKKDFEFWSPEKKDWYFEPGSFKVQVGSSSASIHLSKNILL